MVFFLQVVPITLLVWLAYIGYKVIHLKKSGEAVCKYKEIMRLLFVCYLTGLTNLILVPADLWMFIWSNIFIGYSHSEITLFSGEFNLVPTIFKLIAGELTLGRWVLKMLIYNFLMFMPLGFFLPFIFEKVNNKNIWKIAVIIPIVVELIQPVFDRSFDVDDLILNFAGIIIGYFIAVIIKAEIGKSKLNK